MHSFALWPSAHPQGGLKYLVCVCLPVMFSATTRNKTAKEWQQLVQYFTNFDFAIFVKLTVFKSYGVKQKQRSQYANEYCLTSTCLRCLLIVEASEVTQRSKHESKAVFKCYLQIQLFSRSEKHARGCGLYAYVYTAYMLRMRTEGVHFSTFHFYMHSLWKPYILHISFSTYI